MKSSEYFASMPLIILFYGRLFCLRFARGGDVGTAVILEELTQSKASKPYPQLHLDTPDPGPSILQSFSFFWVQLIPSPPEEFSDSGIVVISFFFGIIRESEILDYLAMYLLGVYMCYALPPESLQSGEDSKAQISKR